MDEGGVDGESRRRAVDDGEIVPPLQLEGCIIHLDDLGGPLEGEVFLGIDVGGHVDDGVILLRIHQCSPNPDHKEQGHVPGQYPDGCLAQLFQPNHSQKERNRQEKEAHKGEKDSILLSLHPYRAFMIWNNLRRFSDKELAKAFQYILQANLALVTGSIDSRLALESLVMNITGGGEGNHDSI